MQYVFYGKNFRPETKNKFRRSSLAKLLVLPLLHLSVWLKQADIMTVIARRKKHNTIEQDSGTNLNYGS